ncbi:MAG: hypothetical protein M1813_007927 [Trichoglossum hirsutum]|jgi:hypothetical protein|nr:MAG: hypothetical protein M1813_007927 [Trichoglossum hirsutum]
MQIYIVAVIAALTFAGAIQLHENDPDGVYIHNTADDGTIETSYVGSVGNFSSSPKFVRRSRLEDPTSTVAVNKRDTGAHCNKLNGSPNDFFAAQAGLGMYFGDDGQHFTGDISFKAQSAVAFACDYGKGQQYTSCQFYADMDAVDGLCGAGGAGWSSHESWKSSYGRTLSSEKYC